jgi:GAF domain-containing protein
MERLRGTKSVGGSWPSARDQSQLAQLAMLPDAALSWVDRPASAIAEDLTELLSRAFPVESVHVHLTSGEDHAEGDVPDPPARPERLVQMQIGSAGEWGRITFVRKRNDFPTPLDVALIRTLAGQVVAALRYAQLSARFDGTQRLLAALSTEQQAITQLGRRFITLNRVDEMLAASLSGVREVLRADFCEIYEVTPDGCSIELRATEGWPSPHASKRSLILGDECEVSFALRSAEPLVIADYLAEQRFRHWAVPRELGARCGASAAISGHRGAFGVLSVHSCALREFTPDE